MANVGIIATKRWVISLINSVLKKYQSGHELTEEHLTGDTFNGKPVYEKTLIYTGSASINTQINIGKIDDLDNIILATGVVSNASGNAKPSCGPKLFQMIVDRNTNIVYGSQSISSASQTFIFNATLKYTKTTD